MYIFLTIQRGRKTYYATVSSFKYTRKNLWLFVWQDDRKGISGNCGYIPNGKVISACQTSRQYPFISNETLKIIKAWDE